MGIRRSTATTAAAAALALLAAASAAAAPVSTAPPAIRGAATYLSTLRCDPGAWSGASGLAYSWREGAAELATGPTWKLEAWNVGHTVHCHVAATDAAGATAEADSPAVAVTPAPMTLRYTLTSPKAGRIRLAGTAGPRAGMKLGTRRATLVLDRVVSAGRLQINAFPLTLPADGRFVLNLKDAPGRHTYVIQLAGPDPSVFTILQKTVTLTVQRPTR